MASNTPMPYISQYPGDLITAENWNQVQVDIRGDITSQVKAALDNLHSVDHAKDADTLGGQTPDQLTQDILKKAEEILPKRTGYFRSFNRLKKGEEKILEHGLKCFPLVNIYQLDYFPAICATSDDDPPVPMWVNFFLYHSVSDRTLKGPGGNPKAVIEAQDQEPFRVLFSDLLTLYNVQYKPGSSLDDLETEFWKAFWGKPNDEFDQDQYGHSPWFEKCCGEKRTVQQLIDTGAWDDIWLKMVPRKTINYPTPPALAPVNLDPNTFDGSVAPTQIQVAQHSFDKVGIKLLLDPVYPQGFVTGDIFQRPENTTEMKVMVLLKV
jgi:hypothetical protein